MPAAKTKDQRFWDRLASRYARRPVADQEIYELKLEKTRAWLTADTEIFEFGCGTGSTALIHAPHVKHVLATDVSERMLEIGRGKAADAGIGNIDFEQTGIETFDPAGRSFDVVLGLNILHLCRDPEAVTRKVHSLLKPGGVFVQSTACLKDASFILRLVLPVMQAAGKAPHISFMSEDDILTMLDTNGFDLVDSLRTDSSMAANFYIARKR